VVLGKDCHPFSINEFPEEECLLAVNVSFDRCTKLHGVIAGHFNGAGQFQFSREGCWHSYLLCLYPILEIFLAHDDAHGQSNRKQGNRY